MSILIKFSIPATTNHSSFNRMRDYSTPTLAKLKYDIITDIFKDIIQNPSLVTKLVNEDGEFMITINNETDLELALKYRPRGQEVFTLFVKENGTTKIPASRSSSSITPSPVATARALSANAPSFTPSPNFTFHANPSYGPSSPSTSTELTPPSMIFTAPAIRIPQHQGNARTIRMPSLNARFVKHITFDPTSSKIYPCIKFLKTWQFRNESHLNWPSQIFLEFSHKLNGDKMSGPDSLPINFTEQIKKDREVNITVPLIAPKNPGTYKGYWRLADESGKKFGTQVEVCIQVADFNKDAVLDNSQSLEQKRKHLQLLFPQEAHDIDNWIINFLTGTDQPLPGVTLNDVLNGSYTKSDGKSFTMEEIIHFAHINSSLNDNPSPFPWPED